MSAFAISSFSFASSSRSNTETLQSGVSLLSFSAVDSARAKNGSFGLKIEMDSAPSNAHCTWIAVAAPPAPRTTIFLPFTSTPCSFKLRTNPIPSVICPTNLPSSLTIVLTAPMILAAGESSSMCFAASFLHGIVTFAPLILKRRIASRAAGTWSSLMSNAM